MRKKFFGVLIACMVLFMGARFVQASEKIYFFWGIGCGHCEKVDKYFRDEGIYDHYPIEKREVYFDSKNAQLFNLLMEAKGVPVERRGVPAVVFGGEVLVGDVSIIDSFEEKAGEYDVEVSEDVEEGELEGETESNFDDTSRSLSLFAVLGAALVDAINPCAFAVLIILMTTVLASGQKGKALKSGLAFSLSIFLSYLLMGLGLYQAIGLVSGGGVALRILGVLAIVLGLLNLKDWLWYGKGFLMEVPLSWRPALKKMIGSVTNPAGAFVVGLGVSLFLLPCTSGPYIVILGMLAERVMLGKALVYLVIYNLVFVAPMILITLLVYAGMPPERLEKMRQGRLRVLHLVAGVVLIGLGLGLLFGVF